MHMRTIGAQRRPANIAGQPHRAHAARRRRFQVGRHILNHHRVGRIDPSLLKKPVKGIRLGLWDVIGRDDIKNLVEMMPQSIGT